MTDGSDGWTPLWKLTDDRMQTYGGYQWALKDTRSAPGRGPLCSAGWLHAYRHPIVALMLNVGDTGIPNPRLFRAEGAIGYTDAGLVVGCTALRLLEELPVPGITTQHRVRMALLSALKVYYEPEWVQWAESWFRGARTRDGQQAQAARIRIAALTQKPASSHAWAAWWAVEAAGMTSFAAEDAAMAIQLASYAAEGTMDFGAEADRAMATS